MPQDANTHAARARALHADILREADATEANRQVSQALMAKIHEARLLRMLIPRSVGGDEVSLPDFTLAVEEVAKADASTAWCVGQGNGVAFGAAFLDTAAAREVFGADDAVVASGPNAPAANAIAVDGGYVVTGEWRFASGSRNARWLGGHCTAYERDGTPRKLAPGQVPQMTVLFPKEQAQVKDTWRVMGLCGTGSDDYAVRELFVPEKYAYTRDFGPDRREQGTLYRFSNFNIFGFAFGGIACGIARSMLDDFIALARDKRASNAPATLRENAAVQQQVGFNEAKLQGARAYLYRTLEDSWAKVERTGECAPRERVMLRMATAYVIQTAKEVAEFAYQAAGATAIFEDRPFERRFRDMHVVTQQGQSHLSNFEAAGQALMIGESAIGWR